MKHVPLKTIQLKNHQVLNEKWLQDIIAEDPSIIGIAVSYTHLTLPTILPV